MCTVSLAREKASVVDSKNENELLRKEIALREDIIDAQDAAESSRLKAELTQTNQQLVRSRADASANAKPQYATRQDALSALFFASKDIDSDFRLSQALSPEDEAKRRNKLRIPVGETILADIDYVFGEYLVFTDQAAYFNASDKKGVQRLTYDC